MIVKFTDEKSGREVEYVEKFWANKISLKIDGQELKRLSRKVFENEKTGEQFTLKGSTSFGLNLINAKGQQLVLVRILKAWEFSFSAIPFLAAFVGILAYFFDERSYFHKVLLNCVLITAIFGLAGFLYAVYNIRKYEKIRYKLLMCSITLIISAVAGVLFTMLAMAVGIMR